MNVKMKAVLKMNSSVEVVNVFLQVGNVIFNGKIVQMVQMKQIVDPLAVNV